MAILIAWQRRSGYFKSHAYDCQNDQLLRGLQHWTSNLSQVRTFEECIYWIDLGSVYF